MHVVPSGAFSMVAERNFFCRRGTCGKVMAGGGGGRGAEGVREHGREFGKDKF